MAELRISTPADFGPVSVEIVTATGERLTSKPTLLSSAQRATTFHDLDPGLYAVIGTRPNGETIVKRVLLEEGAGYAKFGSPQPETPGARPSEAMVRGLVPAVLAETSEDTSSERFRTLNSRLFPTSAGRTLQALLLPKMRVESGLAGGEGGADFEAIDFGEPVVDGKPKELAVRQWMLDGDKWREISEPIAFELKSNYLQLDVRHGVADQPRAFGLIDANGFGPIVIAPLFRRGLSITFLADGLRAGYAAERVSNPSAVRVPVAAAIPQDPGLADLLTALAAASMPDAQRLWQQDAEHRFGATDNALDKLLNKYEDPSAAVLGAHFLARFDPSSAPILWLENLSRILPHIADPLVLLGLRLIAEGSTEARATSRHDIASILLEASRRPCCLFGRTRGMLTQALRLYGPAHSALRPKKDTPARSRRPRTSDFLDVGADAGGLEAFWGANPLSPGRSAKRPRNMDSTTVVHLEGGSFVP